MGQWQLVAIPMALLNPQSLPFAWFDIGDVSGAGASTFYLDDIHLVNWGGQVLDASIPAEERRILAALYKQAYGPGWTVFSGWLSDESPCTWYGVTCKGGVISQLRLSNNNLSGRIPPELSGLDGLEVLQLSDNHLSGLVPPELGSLVNLQHLYLSNNLLAGPIPAELGNLAGLESLDLSFNRLSGTVPAELGNLGSMRYLALYGNGQLGGQIPPELGSLSNLSILLLSSYEVRTHFSGPIPPELGTLDSLTVLLLSNSEVSGPIPPEVGNLVNLVILDLGNNPLSGSLPPELGNLVRLKSLTLGGDRSELVGPLPLTLMNIDDIFYFRYASGMDLCEPRTDEFQEWLDSIPVLDGPRVLCQSEE